MEVIIIRDKIYELRGQRVMLDFDLAALYGVETRTINQAVKRNVGRFPGDFMFRLNRQEWEFIRSQIVTASSRANFRYLFLSPLKPSASLGSFGGIICAGCGRNLRPHAYNFRCFINLGSIGVKVPFCAVCAFSRQFSPAPFRGYKNGVNNLAAPSRKRIGSERASICSSVICVAVRRLVSNRARSFAARSAS